jgi:hypothetical protein
MLVYRDFEGEKKVFLGGIRCRPAGRQRRYATQLAIRSAAAPLAAACIWRACRRATAPHRYAWQTVVDILSFAVYTPLFL